MRIPPPRAFAQGVGVVFQTVGVILFLGNCCICSLSGYLDPVPSHGEVVEQTMHNPAPRPGLVNLLRQPGKTGLMLMLASATIGGLALATFGLGLQSEKPRSAQGAVISVALLLVVLIIAGVALWWGTASVLARLWHAGLTLTVAVLLGFALVALRQMLAHPPPRNLHDLPRGFDIESLKRKH